MLSPGGWRGWRRNTHGRSRFTAASRRGRASPLISRPSGVSPSISTASSGIILNSTFSDPKEKVQTVRETVNILLVDNEPGGLLALEALLEPLGQKLITARSGHEALRHLLAHDFALILLDIQMPGLDGFETAALIRQREKSRHTPIIFLTAINKTEQHVFKGYSLGAVDYLTKPFVPEVLLSKVSAFVELHKQTDLVKRQTGLLQQMVAELAGSNDEIRKLNVALQSERDFVSTVLDTADSIIVVLDATPRIIRASRAIERILGYAREEVNGRPISSFFI